MKFVFVDTHFILALLNPRDTDYPRVQVAIAVAKSHRPVTTQWVLTEVADAFKYPVDREAFLAYLSSIERDPRMTIVSATDELFRRGIELYGRRRDKSWSLTDCISFVVMNDLGITEALTGDQHFRQAGFETLL